MEGVRDVFERGLSPLDFEMAGAREHGTFVHIPFGLVTNGRRRVDPAGDLWQAVLECTGQPARIL